MTAFLYEIVATAGALRDARAFDGSPALRFDRQWQVLTAIERCGGAPTFTDIGRCLDVSRQAARDFVKAAATAGLVELFLAPFAWIFTLLKGLEPDKMRAANRVLYVLRRRLEAYERERYRAAFSAASPRR